MLKPSELISLSVDDLKAKVKDINEEIFKIRMQSATGAVTNKTLTVTKRRDLARVKTVLNEKLRGAVK